MAASHLVQTFSVYTVLFRCFKQRTDRIAMICIVQYLELVSPQPALMVGIFQLPKSVCFSAFSFTNELGFYVHCTTNCTNLTILRDKFIGFFFLFLACKTLHLCGAWPYHYFTVFGHRSGEVFYAPMRIGFGELPLRLNLKGSGVI